VATKSSTSDPLSSLSRVDCLQSGAWEFVTPNPALAPIFRAVTIGANTRRALVAEGNGRRECYGYAWLPVELKAGKSYKLSVKLTAEGMDFIEHHVVHAVHGPSYSGGLFSLRTNGKTAVGEERFHGPPEAMEAQLRLYFRYSARGRVTWEEVFLEECEPIAPRPVTFACTQGQMLPGATLAFWEERLDRAGRRKSDLVLLPEAFDGIGPASANPPEGPACALLSAKARQWQMYTCGSFYEARGDLIYNVAPLFDRSGRLVGVYEKFMPYQQELDQGVSPGRELRVFDVDFGRVGILTCYDSWFPETARRLAHIGAEVILLPNAGYFEELMPARAADNGVCIVASSQVHSAGVWGSSGVRAGELTAGNSRESPSAVLSVEIDSSSGLFLATVDLSKKYSPHWKGGPMMSAPAARAARVTSVRPLCLG